MKLIYKVFAAAAGILALSSCVEEAIAPLTGVYEKPVIYEMNTLVSQSVEKGEKTRTFTVELSGSNASLNMKFIGDKYFLHDAGYTAAPVDVAKKGNYIVGNEGSTFTLGGTAIPVESGTLTVAQADGNYSFKGMLWLADETVVEIRSSVALVYEPDPEPVIMSSILLAQNNTLYGVNSVTVQLAQDGIYSEFDMTTYQNKWYGEGNYMAIDLYSADGYLHEGIYTANTVGGVIGEGQFGIGYDTTVDYGWGPMEMKDYGTCWWTVSNGAATAQKILDGTVTVTKKGSKWIIELISGEGKNMIWGKFEGAIEALTPQETTTPTPEYTMTEKVEQVLDQTWAPVSGVEKHVLTLTSGETVAAVFELITAEGGAIEGTYTCQEYASAAGLMGNGYSIPDWNMEGGSRYWVNGELVLINAGETLEVTKYAEGLYGFSGSSGYEFIASTADYTGGNNGSQAEYIDLTDFLSLTSYVSYGSNLVGVELATTGVSYTTDWTTWTTTYNGEGNYIKLEFYSTDGTIAPGTYNACAVGGTVGEGEFGIGYDGSWGASGSTWYTVSGGAATYEYITDGTATVEVDGDTYTITLESSTINARYVGTLTL